MDAVKIYPEQVISSEQKDYRVLSIKIWPPNKDVDVEAVEQLTIMVDDGEGGQVEQVVDGSIVTFHLKKADLEADWAMVSEANKTVIRAFLKKLVALALAIETTSIDGDVL